VRFVIDVYKALDMGSLAVGIWTDDGIPVHDMQNRDAGCPWRASLGTHIFTVTIPHLSLYPRGYVVGLWAGDHQTICVDLIENAVKFQVVQTPRGGLDRTLDRRRGVMFQTSKWSHIAPQPCLAAHGNTTLAEE
jgi:hypothetical protein